MRRRSVYCAMARMAATSIPYRAIQRWICVRALPISRATAEMFPFEGSRSSTIRSRRSRSAFVGSLRGCGRGDGAALVVAPPATGDPGDDHQADDQDAPDPADHGAAQLLAPVAGGVWRSGEAEVEVDPDQAARRPIWVGAGLVEDLEAGGQSGQGGGDLGWGRR